MKGFFQEKLKATRYLNIAILIFLSLFLIGQYNEHITAIKNLGIYLALFLTLILFAVDTKNVVQNIKNNAKNNKTILLLFLLLNLYVFGISFFPYDATQNAALSALHEFKRAFIFIFIVLLWHDGSYKNSKWLFFAMVAALSIDNIHFFVKGIEDGTLLNLKNERVQWLEDELGDPTRFVVVEDAYERALKEKVYQLNVFVSEEEEEDFMQLMPNSKTARWTSHFTDIIPKDGGKNKGIDAIINHFGIKLEETMAFGDGGNDIDMLKHAGIGIAMENARDDVKEIADFITTSVDDDGITNALKHYNVL